MTVQASKVIINLCTPSINIKTAFVIVSTPGVKICTPTKIFCTLYADINTVNEKFVPLNHFIATVSAETLSLIFGYVSVSILHYTTNEQYPILEATVKHL